MSEENTGAGAVATAERLKHNRKLAIVGDIKEDTRITWNVDANPRSAGRATHARFARYFGSTTVAEYVAAGGTKGDLLWDLRSGYLSLDGVRLSDNPADRPAKAPKAPKEPKSPKAPKEPKAPKAAKEPKAAKRSKKAEQPAADAPAAEAEAETQSEVID